MTPTTIILIYCAAIPALIFITAVLSWLHAEKCLRATHAKDMANLLAEVKPAIRHNRSWPMIERAAEAIRVYEEANQPEKPARTDE